MKTLSFSLVVLCGLTVASCRKVAMPEPGMPFNARTASGEVVQQPQAIGPIPVVNPYPDEDKKPAKPRTAVR